MAGLIRLEAVWGSDLLIEAPPPVERQGEVLYMPWAHERPWGLFDRQGLAMSGAWEHKPEGSPVPPAFTAFRLDQPLAADPALWTGASTHREPLIYGGRMHLHFGHFLLETLPRLWLSQRRRLRRSAILVHGPIDLETWFAVPWLRDLLDGLGLTRADFVWFNKPTICRTLELPHPALRPQSYVHRVFGDLCREIGARVAAESASAGDPRPVYLSKSRLQSGVMRLADEVEVERLLAEHGVEIAYPETLRLAQQIALFATRPAVLGTAGSAFHLGVFAPPTARQIRLNLPSMVNANHRLLDHLGGHAAIDLHQQGTEAEADSGPFTVSWRLPDPRGAAEGMLAALGA